MQNVVSRNCCMSPLESRFHSIQRWCEISQEIVSNYLDAYLQRLVVLKLSLSELVLSSKFMRDISRDCPELHEQGSRITCTSSLEGLKVSISDLGILPFSSKFIRNVVSSCCWMPAVESRFLRMQCYSIFTNKYLLLQYFRYRCYSKCYRNPKIEKYVITLKQHYISVRINYLSV